MTVTLNRPTETTTTNDGSINPYTPTPPDLAAALAAASDDRLTSRCGWTHAGLATGAIDVSDAYLADQARPESERLFTAPDADDRIQLTPVGRARVIDDAVNAMLRRVGAVTCGNGVA